jgi:hypothetical protein
MASALPSPVPATVPAYPRHALEQYLADLATAAERLRADIATAHQRTALAQAAIAARDEGHRLLGALLVDAERDLAARRAHAEEAAADLLARAAQEAERILAAARAEAGALLALAPEAGLAASGPDRDRSGPAGPSALALGWELLAPSASSSPVPGWASAEPAGPAEPSAPADPVGPVAPVAEPSIDEPHELPPAAAWALDGSGVAPWRRRLADGAAHLRSRLLGETGFEWPAEAVGRDEAYFTRLRDELDADGSLARWFEPA